MHQPGGDHGFRYTARAASAPSSGRRTASTWAPGADHVKHGIDDLDSSRGAGHRAGFPVGHLRHPHPAAHALPLRQRARHGREVHPRGCLVFRLSPTGWRRLRERHRRDGSRSAAAWSWSGWAPASASSGTGQSCSRRTAVDFVIGSVHFAPDGIPYDGSARGHAGSSSGCAAAWSRSGPPTSTSASRWWTRRGR